MCNDFISKIDGAKTEKKHGKNKLESKDVNIRKELEIFDIIELFIKKRTIILAVFSILFIIGLFYTFMRAELPKKYAVQIVILAANHTKYVSQNDEIILESYSLSGRIENWIKDKLYLGILKKDNNTIDENTYVTFSRMENSHMLKLNMVYEIERDGKALLLQICQILKNDIQLNKLLNEQQNEISFAIDKMKSEVAVKNDRIREYESSVAQITKIISESEVLINSLKKRLPQKKAIDQDLMNSKETEEKYMKLLNEYNELIYEYSNNLSLDIMTNKIHIRHYDNLIVHMKKEIENINHELKQLKNMVNKVKSVYEIVNPIYANEIEIERITIIKLIGLFSCAGVLLGCFIALIAGLLETRRKMNYSISE